MLDLVKKAGKQPSGNYVPNYKRRQIYLTEMVRSRIQKRNLVSVSIERARVTSAEKTGLLCRRKDRTAVHKKRKISVLVD